MGAPLEDRHLEGPARQKSLQGLNVCDRGGTVVAAVEHQGGQRHAMERALHLRPEAQQLGHRGDRHRIVGTRCGTGLLVQDVAPVPLG